MSTFSNEHKLFLKREKRKKHIIVISQILIITSLLIIWQILANLKVINTFLFSSPNDIVKTIIKINNNELLSHIYITTYETIISFLLASGIGLIFASILWRYEILAKIFDPYLTIINSLPKVALGPLIIIWIGTSINSIIFMALLISVIVSIINIYTAFLNTDNNYITLLKSFNATKFQILTKIVIPSNIINILNTLKINISMSLVGVIMGELLVSKKGLGYLIMYGTQVFNINIVITSIVILGIISYIFYYIIHIIEKKLTTKC